jgi:hypothetical protein
MVRTVLTAASKTGDSQVVRDADYKSYDMRRNTVVVELRANTGTPSFSVQPLQSLDGTHWYNLGSAISAAGISVITCECPYFKLNVGTSNEKSTDVGYCPACADRFGLPWGKKMPKQPLVAEAVEPEWQPKLSTEQKIFEADLVNQIAASTPTIEPNSVAHTAMTDLLAKFEGDAAAMILLNKLAELAKMEKAA